jgi:secreted PhoX family phosphatase
MIDSDDIPSNLSSNNSFEQVLNKRSGRRKFLKTSLAASIAAVTGLAGCSRISTALLKEPKTEFTELKHGLDENLHVSPGYNSQVVIRWGDPIFASAPTFDPLKQTEEKQLQQFGFNNDFVGFVSLPLGSNNSDSGLLVVNHEYCSPELMHQGSPNAKQLTQAQTAIDKAATGLSIIEINRIGDTWNVNLDSPYNRRITPDTPMQITGPAMASSRLRTNASSNGIESWGTYGNCAGGVTPWGTILTGEENIQDFFDGDYAAADQKQRENYERFGLHSNSAKASWPLFYDRWNMSKNPNEPLHAGWIVEIDPFDPHSTPKKRTALGRFKHEGCNVTINADGYVVAYSGDDQVFEYLYRFVSSNKYQPNNRIANMDLLDEGTLYVAEFDEHGVNWNALVYGQGPLTEANGFMNQADICLDTRKAADLVGATRMDRPEDVEVNPVTGSVFVMLTKNAKRTVDQEDAVNPRANNRGGQVLELIPPNGDHSAARFEWDLLIVAGELNKPTTKYHPDTSENGWLACPDNCAFDNEGNIWITTDGATDFGIADGLWVSPVAGKNRGRPKHFLRTPVGAELCGPCFTPNNQSFFCAVQHPGSGGSFDKPITRWPDFVETMPARPSLVVVTHPRGLPVGSAV